MITLKDRAGALGLDRNGFRPFRYVVTDNGVVSAALKREWCRSTRRRSAKIAALGPGQILAVDTKEHRFLRDRGLKDEPADSQPFRDRVNSITRPEETIGTVREQALCTVHRRGTDYVPSRRNGQPACRGYPSLARQEVGGIRSGLPERAGRPAGTSARSVCAVAYGMNGGTSETLHSRSTTSDIRRTRTHNGGSSSPAGCSRTTARSMCSRATRTG